MVYVVHLLAKGKSLCSPDGRLNFELLDNQPGGELFYEINYKGVPVIRSSLLRISNREANMEIERVLEVFLYFLDPNKEYALRLFADGGRKK